ncbi:MAG: hypothetical protein HXS54_17290 [Theionarchaea archaeon]|nr:hypothetical protein [Theionarchaea archaeon]
MYTAHESQIKTNPPSFDSYRDDLKDDFVEYEINTDFQFNQKTFSMIEEGPAMMLTI